MGLKAEKAGTTIQTCVMMTKQINECFIKHADLLLEMDKKYGFR